MPQVLETQECAFHHGPVARHAGLVAKREAGRDDRPRGVERPKGRQAFAVQCRSLSLRGRELQGEKGRDHHAGDGDALVEQSHRNGDDRESAREVRRAVEGVDGPHGSRPRTSALLGEHRDPWGLAREHLENGGLRPTVESRHVVPCAFRLGRTAGPGKAGVDENAGARARGAQRDGQKVVQAFLSSSPRPNIASRSWAENC